MKDRINKKELMAFLAWVGPSNAWEANVAMIKAIALHDMRDITFELLKSLTMELCAVSRTNRMFCPELPGTAAGTRGIPTARVPARTISAKNGDIGSERNNATLTREIEPC